MSASNSRVQAASSDYAQREASTRLYGSRLLIARSIWGIVIAFALGMFVATLFIYPRFFALATTPCSGHACFDFQGSPASVQVLQKLGISPAAFITLFLIFFSFIPAPVWIAMGIILVWRKSDDWYALLVSLWLITWGVGFATDFGGVPAIEPAFSLTAHIYSILYQIFILPAILLFPNGRLTPRWSIALVAIWTIAQFPIPFADLLQFVAILGTGITLIYRYVRVLTLVQRQQAKWLVFALITDILVFWIGWRLLSLALPSLTAQGALGDALDSMLWAMIFLLIPISIGIAMMRYRLWDIDIIINRTLVYGLLSAILGALYVGLVLGLQFLFDRVAGPAAANSPLILVGTTLIIAALFQPLRHRIQRIIDRRFYRSKYDARRTIASFSTTLRGEVELAQLSEQLVAVVEETMQPAHVSLWLNKPQQSRSAFYKEKESAAGVS